MIVLLISQAVRTGSDKDTQANEYSVIGLFLGIAGGAIMGSMVGFLFAPPQIYVGTGSVVGGVVGYLLQLFIIYGSGTEDNQWIKSELSLSDQSGELESLKQEVRQLRERVDEYDSGDSGISTSVMKRAVLGLFVSDPYESFTVEDIISELPFSLQEIELIIDLLEHEDLIHKIDENKWIFNSTSNHDMAEEDLDQESEKLNDPESEPDDGDKSPSENFPSLSDTAAAVGGIGIATLVQDIEDNNTIIMSFDEETGTYSVTDLTTGIVTQGETRENALYMIADAIELTKEAQNETHDIDQEVNAPWSGSGGAAGAL